MEQTCIFTGSNGQPPSADERSGSGSRSGPDCDTAFSHTFSDNGTAVPHHSTYVSSPVSDRCSEQDTDTDSVL